MQPNEAAGIRRVLAERALADIPKLLTLLDRTPVSPTYGCFDRSYWHYRISDFPCGMSQEFVWPLALAWSLDLPGNPYRGDPSIRAWIEAGIRFAARSAHRDGSCDDYYPFERATGAAAFSLIAMLEASALTGLTGDPEVEAFLARRARWLAGHEESGRLSNHEALIVACLVRAALRFDGDWEEAIRRRLGRLLGWQSEEGWFDEYGGADPGYLTLTIALLADIDRLRPDLGVREPCRRAIRFIADFVHPDGTVGGEYASRGTTSFFPHGFEIAGAWMPEALAINDRALRPLAEGRQPSFSDDRIIGHHLWSWLLAWQEFRSERPLAADPPAGRLVFDGAGLIVDRRPGAALFLATTRGGALKIFGEGKLLLSDTGPTLAVGGRVAVTHLPGSTASIEADRIVIEGRMAWARSARLTPAKSVLLRVIMLVFGRFRPDLVRRLLQRALVTGRQDAPFRFRREIEWTGGGWRISDRIAPDAGWSRVSGAGISGFQTSTTTVMARVFRPEQLQPWLDLGSHIGALRGSEALKLERFAGPEGEGGR